MTTLPPPIPTPRTTPPTSVQPTQGVCMIPPSNDFWMNGVMTTAPQRLEVPVQIRIPTPRRCRRLRDRKQKFSLTCGSNIQDPIYKMLVIGRVGHHTLKEHAR